MDVRVLNTIASNIAIVQVWDKDVLIATFEVREELGETTIKTTAHIMSSKQSHTFNHK